MSAVCDVARSARSVWSATVSSAVTAWLDRRGSPDSASEEARYGLLVPEMVRMGVRAGIAADQRPFGTSSAVVVTVDESGTELARDVVPDAPGLALWVVHFVDLDDGARVTTEAFGGMSLSLSRACTLDELREELREFIFEDDLREVDTELADEPRWEEMCSVLRAQGIAGDEQALLALPFAIELDDGVAAELSREC